jgi:hypothetical protein
MNDETLIICIFARIDDIVKTLGIDPHPGPVGRLSLSEILTLMVLHPLLKSGKPLKFFCLWLEKNWKQLFPNLVEYSWLRRLFNAARDYIEVIQQKMANLKCFGLVADGTPLPVMHVKRGPFAKSFRNGRKVKCASKNEWFWGFLLELVLDQQGMIAYFSISTQAEIRQLTNILEDLKDHWVMADKGNRGKAIHAKLWKEKQIRIKITQSKERTWIENVIGVLKNNLALDKLHVRVMDSLLTRVSSILCAYNLANLLSLPI